ncbi:MAG: hypothetical protein UT87_C0007G0016 [Candidatus Levybacteria bacterium GW2011_GWC1_40_19]|nr:MAG: hypothetical protein UT46_C0004G0002 [Candidatus Levybacteria bacterium GW2011_GWA1_39_34]KKR51256.1 MAG: hypothetical protein UT87_C0007G0016 [Candidatus Levybacteria bacterium GW2011_GWC1_40_19]KKR73861.1 MAG: hypothetical protein UU15_C0001G0036 [Candidatus Levybacteria bacterium GW2011_GWC2_40_7]KKR94656.1 MAG: hypothetical protein UU45_C0008G0056 [Candidatus Levybacteria bacterium GW2011_GWA2_41_15]KKS02024.1 MAG: hypothetical protein UU52_C0004G0002 [Candidatus Levybacteria bacter
MSSQNKQCLAALAMDLKRVALGYYHGSNKTAERFFDEALERRREIELSGVKPYVRKLLLKLDSIKKEKDVSRRAEDALMYSTLFQNAALSN